MQDDSAMEVMRLTLPEAAFLAIISSIGAVEIAAVTWVVVRVVSGTFGG